MKALKINNFGRNYKSWAAAVLNIEEKEQEQKEAPKNSIGEEKQKETNK